MAKTFKGWWWLVSFFAVGIAQQPLLVGVTMPVAAAHIGVGSQAPTQWTDYFFSALALVGIAIGEHSDRTLRVRGLLCGADQLGCLLIFANQFRHFMLICVYCFMCVACSFFNPHSELHGGESPTACSRRTSSITSHTRPVELLQAPKLLWRATILVRRSININCRVHVSQYLSFCLLRSQYLQHSYSHITLTCSVFPGGRFVDWPYPLGHLGCSLELR